MTEETTTKAPQGEDSIGERPSRYSMVALEGMDRVHQRTAAFTPTERAEYNTLTVGADRNSIIRMLGVASPEVLDAKMHKLWDKEHGVKHSLGLKGDLHHEGGVHTVRSIAERDADVATELGSYEATERKVERAGLKIEAPKPGGE